MALAIDDLNFDQTLAEAAEMPVVVDFWATWCGPCRMISPIIDEMAEKYDGKVVIAKCNVDDSTEVPMKYGIRNIPTILFFKNGELVDRVVGAVPKDELESKIASLV
jgi:thioredoxin